MPQLTDEMLRKYTADSWRQSARTVRALGPKARAEEEAADTEFMTPNVEVTGARRHGALAAMRNMDNERVAARVPCRSASG